MTEWENRFWAKVQKTDSCWLWTGTTWTTTGRPSFKLGGRNVSAYRLAYELLVDPIPEGLQLDHVKANGCTSKLCVKAIADEFGPAHLEAVTNRENARRYWADYTVCRQGHPYDEVNTYRYPAHGKRKCRACARERSVVRRAQRRLEGVAS